jgi:hypothetical protein
MEMTVARTLPSRVHGVYMYRFQMKLIPAPIAAINIKVVNALAALFIVQLSK